MLKLKAVTPALEGTVEDPKIATILVNPDHVVCITEHETNPKWSRVNLLDDYEFIVEGSPTDLAKLQWREPL
jgi:hypothetical protein